MIVQEIERCRRMHGLLGWWALVVFVGLGLGLEMLHGLKVGWYLDVSQGTRRLMWTLAHAHGTLLGLLNLAFAWSLGEAPSWAEGGRRLASRFLMAATVLLPGGFFLGGFGARGGDPGPAIALAAAGGLALFLAVALTARAMTAERPVAERPAPGAPIVKGKSKG